MRRVGGFADGAVAVAVAVGSGVVVLLPVLEKKKKKRMEEKGVKEERVVRVVTLVAHCHSGGCVSVISITGNNPFLLHPFFSPSDNF